MTTVTDADRAATAAYYDRATDILARAPCPPGVTLVSIMDEAFARHREAAEARARIEGAEIMREAAADAFEIPDGEPWDDCCIDTLYVHECAILNLDPAAILAAHTRAKAMDELIAGDADTL